MAADRPRGNAPPPLGEPRLFHTLTRARLSCKYVSYAVEGVGWFDLAEGQAEFQFHLFTYPRIC
jgi:hypothetical protein